MDRIFQNKINDLKKQNLYRDQNSINERLSRQKELINFSSNDYLGLAEYSLSEILNINAKDYSVNNLTELMQIPFGSSGSRLTTGTHLEHKELEDCIASWKACEDTIIFSSGYLANLGALSALIDKDDVVFIDELAHSCMWDALRINNARKYIFAHNDAQELRRLIQKYRYQYTNSFIITESVFSMDGDLAPLDDLKSIADEYSSFLYIDEAHSTGIYGASGAGLISEYKEKNPQQDFSNLIQMGTLSKAIGLEGGYISGSSSLIDFLRNKARTYVYSTASSPFLMKIARHNIQKIIHQNDLRQKLFSNIKYLDSLLSNLKTKNEMDIENKFHWTNFGSPIFTIQFQEIDKCLTVSNKLLEKGFICTSIRPPTVKIARLRICVSSKHSHDQILSFYAALSIALAA
ncbi:MAG: pyridoxal phosphate-dependent aminotransferase family protein [Proteobacteria bacterium]|nr:pyridoxal phosphate-dependent aminotransferase family protein [Pseudomonadota bacterium]